MITVKYINSPIGYVMIEAGDNYVTKISVSDVPPLRFHDGEELDSNMQQCERELIEYFEGRRKHFTFKYKNIGTPFRERVWQQLEKIPYGETVSYRDIAKSINNENAVRAVGGANHHNNLWIVVPCHRVIGSNGHLTGYGGGIWRKEWLLDHEKKFRGGL